MDAATIKAMGLLKANRNRLTKQQFRTLKGQVLSGDIAGAYKGLLKIQTQHKTNRNGGKHYECNHKRNPS